jgi:hypothetical protein
MIPVPQTPAALQVATGAAAATLASALVTNGNPGQNIYALVCNADFWFAQGIADTVFTADSATDQLTVVAGHNLVTGMPVQVSNSGGALPTGLSAATTYWAIVVSTTVFKLATSRALAFAGTAIDITANGTGTQTATTVATAGAGSMLLPAGAMVILDGVNGAKVSVIQDVGAGKASLTPLGPVR